MGTSPLWLLFAMAALPMAASVPELNIDLVLIPHMEAQQWVTEVDTIKAALLEIFPTVFVMGPAKSRVAMVYNSLKTGTFNTYELKSTRLCDNDADAKRFFDYIKRYRASAPHDKSLANAFNNARKIFTYQKSENIRVILVVSFPHGLPVVIQDTDKAAIEEARKEGIHMYAVYQRKDTEDGPDGTANLALITGHTEKIYKINKISSFNATLFEWLKSKLIQHFALVSLCNYVEECFFQDPERKQCKKSPYTPNMTLTDGDCVAVSRPPPPATNEDCDVDVCRETCDDLWKFEVAECNDNCGKSLPKQTPKRWNQLEHCAPEFQCDACPTTTTTTTTTPTPTTTPTTTPSTITTTPTTPTTTTTTTAGVRAQVGMVLIIVAFVIAMLGGV